MGVRPCTADAYSSPPVTWKARMPASLTWSCALATNEGSFFGGFVMLRLCGILRAALLLLCLSFVARGADREAAGGIKVDKEKRTVTIDCKVAPRKMEDP